MKIQNNKKIYSSIQECLDDCIICSDSYINKSSICKYNFPKNKQRFTLILIIQNTIYGPETSRKKTEYNENGGDPDVF